MKDFNKLEKKIKTKVFDPRTKKIEEYEIVKRINPAFNSLARINPAREKRPLKIKKIKVQKRKKDCFFCDPENKCARFVKPLEPLYYLNDSVAFSNLYPLGEISGVIVHNYKKHVIDARSTTIKQWNDSLQLAKKVCIESNKKFLSYNINNGPKGAASQEHFHAQFLCQNKEFKIVELVKRLVNKDWWKSWLDFMNKKKLVISKKNNVYLYSEWAPAFGKVELVVLSLKSPSLLQMDKNEIMIVSKFLKKGIDFIADNISGQFNMLGLSSNKDFCNQFRIIPRSPLNEGLKTWEGYLEFMNETVPHISPESIAKLLRRKG